jgi:nitrogen fixation NifU-like protein
VHGLLTGARLLADQGGLGELDALAGVSKYPMRVKCATLSWHALKAALRDQGPESVTTE